MAAVDLVADKEGILLVSKDAKGKNAKPFLLRLIGGSLFAFRIRPEGTSGNAVKWSIQLNDSLLDERLGTDSFAINYYNKNYVFMAPLDASLSRNSSSKRVLHQDAEPVEWLPFIKAGMQREPVQLPKETKGFVFRTKKGFMSSAMGQSVLTRVIDKRAKKILKSVKKIVSVMNGPRTADSVEKKIVKLIVVSYFHYEAGRINQEDVGSIESYLRRALKTVLIVLLNYTKITNEAQRMAIVKERLEEVTQNLGDTTTHYKRLLEPFCDKKELEWIDLIYNSFSNVDKLYKVLYDKSAAESINFLVAEIKEYLGWDASGVDNLALLYGTPKGGFGF